MCNRSTRRSYFVRTPQDKETSDLRRLRGPTPRESVAQGKARRGIEPSLCSWETDALPVALMDSDLPHWRAQPFSFLQCGYGQKHSMFSTSSYVLRPYYDVVITYDFPRFS